MEELHRPRSDAPPIRTMEQPSLKRVVVWECRAGGTSPVVEMRCHVHALLMRGERGKEEEAKE
jgi:hypothetical protein